MSANIRCSRNGMSQGRYNGPVHGFMPQRNHNLGFLGNPGTGKSTLANNLVQRAVFRSGPVFNGRGLTRELETYYDKENGVMYFTPPGLDDPFEGGRMNAARFTEEGLRLGGPTKIIFVMTIEAGRICQADLVTKNLILDSLANVQNLQFGIIVNKISQNFLKALVEDEDRMKEFSIAINAGCERKTPYVHFMACIEELTDNADALHPMPDALRAFIDLVPIVTINPVDVRPINVAEFDLNFWFLRGAMRTLYQDRANYLKEFQRQRESIIEQYAEILQRAGMPVRYNLFKYRARVLIFRLVFPTMHALGLALKAVPMLAPAGA